MRQPRPQARFLALLQRRAQRTAVLQTHAPAVHGAGQPCRPLPLQHRGQVPLLRQQ